MGEEVTVAGHLGPRFDADGDASLDPVLPGRPGPAGGLRLRPLPGPSAGRHQSGQGLGDHLVAGIIGMEVRPIGAWCTHPGQGAHGSRSLRLGRPMHVDCPGAAHGERRRNVGHRHPESTVDGPERPVQLIDGGDTLSAEFLTQPTVERGNHERVVVPDTDDLDMITGGFLHRRQNGWQLPVDLFDTPGPGPISWSVRVRSGSLRRWIVAFSPVSVGLGFSNLAGWSNGLSPTTSSANRVPWLRSAPYAGGGTRRCSRSAAVDGLGRWKSNPWSRSRVPRLIGWGYFLNGCRHRAGQGPKQSWRSTSWPNRDSGSASRQRPVGVRSASLAVPLMIRSGARHGDPQPHIHAYSRSSAMGRLRCGHARLAQTQATYFGVPGSNERHCAQSTGPGALAVGHLVDDGWTTGFDHRSPQLVFWAELQRSGFDLHTGDLLSKSGPTPS